MMADSIRVIVVTVLAGLGVDTVPPLPGELTHAGIDSLTVYSIHSRVADTARTSRWMVDDSLFIESGLVSSAVQYDSPAGPWACRWLLYDRPGPCYQKSQRSYIVDGGRIIWGPGMPSVVTLEMCYVTDSIWHCDGDGTFELPIRQTEQYDLRW